jgi:hypothetical protein
MRNAVVLGIVAFFMVSSAAFAECGGHAKSASAPSQSVVTGSTTTPMAPTKDGKS